MMTIGFIDFGEAAFHIAKGLRMRGANIVAYDINANAPTLGNLIQQRARDGRSGRHAARGGHRPDDGRGDGATAGLGRRAQTTFRAEWADALPRYSD